MSILFLAATAVVNWQWGTTPVAVYSMVVLLFFSALGMTGRRALWVDPEKERISLVYFTFFVLPWSRMNFQFSDFKTVILETSIDDSMRRKQGDQRRAWFHEVELVGDKQAYITRFNELGKAVAFSEDLARRTGLEFKETVAKPR